MIYSKNSFLRLQNSRPVRKRGRYTESPSKYLSLDFLSDLRANDYKSATGIEYVPSEVDSLYFLKAERNAELAQIKHFKNYYSKK